MAFLNQLHTSVYFLPASQQIASDRLPKDATDRHRVRFDDYLHSVPIEVAEREITLREESQPAAVTMKSLLRIMRLATDWIREQTLRANNRGSGSTHGIYAEIVRHLASTPEGANDGEPRTIADDVASTLKELEERSTQYASFGFTAPLDVKDMLSALERDKSNRTSMIAGLLKPYVDGVNARLNELQGIYELTSILIANANSFLANKKISFNLNVAFVSSESTTVSAYVLNGCLPANNNFCCYSALCSCLVIARASC
jgi:hypothetical protein